MPDNKNIPKWEDTTEAPTWDETEPLKKKEDSGSPSQSDSEVQSSTNEPKLKLQGLSGDKMKGELVEKPSSIFRGDKYSDIEYDLKRGDDIGKPWKVGYSNMVNAWADAAKLTDWAFYSPEPNLPLGMGTLAGPALSKAYKMSKEEAIEFGKKKSDLLDNPIVGQFMHDVIMKGDVDLSLEDLPSGKYANNPDNWKGYTDMRRAYMTIAHNLPLMGSFVASTALTGPFSAVMMGAVEAGQANEAIIEYEKATGKKVDPATREMIITSVGAINGVLERVGIDAVMGKIPGIKGIIGKWIAGTITEGSTEALQELNQLIGEESYRKLEPEEWERIRESAYAGSLLGFLGSGMTSVVSQMKEKVKQQEIERGKRIEKIKENDDIFNEVKKKSIVPELNDIYFKDIIKDVPQEYKKETRQEMAELLVKKDALQAKADKASLKSKPSFDKQVKELEKRLSDVIAKEEGLLEEESEVSKKPKNKPSEKTSLKVEQLPTKEEIVAPTPPKSPENTKKEGKVTKTSEELEKEEMYNEMVDKYGKKRADELMSEFVKEEEKYSAIEPIKGKEEKEKIYDKSAKEIDEKLKTEKLKENDTKNKEWVRSKKPKGEKFIEEEFIEKTSQEKIEADRVFQTSKKEIAKEKANQFRNKQIEQEMKKSKTAGIFGGIDNKNDFYRTYINKERGIPKSIYRGNLAVAGKVNRAEYEARWLGKDLYKKAEKAYKEFGEKQMNDIQVALENMGTTKESTSKAFKNIPKEIHPEIFKMRKTIDALTNELLKLNILSEESSVKYDQNKGFYVTRSYRRGADKKWTWERVPLKVKEDAFRVIESYYPDYSVDKIEGILKSMLLDPELAGTMAGGKYGKVNKDILKRRSQFLTNNPEIRNFLGEYRDPAYNYAVSITKMTELIERTKFLRKSAEIGLEQGFLSEDITPGHTAKIGTDEPFSFYERKDGKVVVNPPKSEKGYKPLSEYYATPEVAKAFNSFNDINKNIGPLMRAYMRFLVTPVKLSKTAFSIRGIERNFLSNPINVVGNGNWNFGGIIKEMKPFFMGDASMKQKGRDLLAYLIENNMIKDNVDAGMIRANLKQLGDFQDKVGVGDEGFLKKSLKMTSKTMLNLYEFGDDFWKTFRFFSEKSRYKKVYLKQGKSEKIADDMSTERARDILHDTTAFYSQQPKLLQALRYFPTSGTFVSFPYLTMRNAFHTIKLAGQEMSNKDTFHIGLQRIAGMMIATSTLSLVAGLFNRANLLDPEDMEELRRFLPKFWKNDIIAIRKELGEGKYRFSNPTYMDYYNSVTTPVLMMIRRLIANGELIKDDLFEAVSVFFEPYVSEDILFKKLKNLYQNYDIERGKKIYDGNDFSNHPIKFFIDTSEYLWEAFEPATITDIKRVLQAKKEGGDWKGYLTGLMKGSQIRTLDIERSMRFYNVREAKEYVETIMMDFYEAKRRNRKTGENIDKSINLAEKKLNKVVDELRKDIDAAVNHGVPIETIEDILKDSRLDKDLRNSIFTGQDITVDLELGITTKD